MKYTTEWNDGGGAGGYGLWVVSWYRVLVCLGSGGGSRLWSYSCVRLPASKFGALAKTTDKCVYVFLCVVFVSPC